MPTTAKVLSPGYHTSRYLEWRGRGWWRVAKRMAAGDDGEGGAQTRFGDVRSINVDVRASLKGPETKRFWPFQPNKQSFVHHPYPSSWAISLALRLAALSCSSGRYRAKSPAQMLLPLDIVGQ